MRLPRLRFSAEPLVPLAASLLQKDTLIVTDRHNIHSVRHLAPTVCVRDNRSSQLRALRRRRYGHILAVGGCTALDIGRAAAEGKELTALPTILSTSCISVDRSVLNTPTGYRSVHTIAPRETVLSLPALHEGSPEHRWQWTSSGFGDLFSNISAAIDFSWKRNGESFVGITDRTIKKEAPEAFAALRWARTSPRLDIISTRNLKKLAALLHASSLSVIERGDTLLSADGEHKLYYIMLRREHYPPEKPTHGQLVGIGTLLSARAYGEAIGDCALFEQLRSAFHSVRLPCTPAELRAVNVTRQRFVANLETLKADWHNHLTASLAHHGYAILNRAFTA